MDFPKYLTGLIIGVLLSLLFKGCGKTEEGGKDVVRHTTDTLYLPREVHIDTVVIPRYYTYTKPGKEVVLHDTIYQSTSVPALQALLRGRTYQDTIPVVKGLQVNYTGYVHGVLDSLEFRVVDTRPLMVIKDSTTITHTLPPKSHSLGIGAVVTSLGVAPGLQYTQGKNVIGLHYLVPSSPGLQGIQATYTRNIVSW